MNERGNSDSAELGQREVDAELRLVDSPRRWQLYSGECIAEVVCSTLLIVIVYTEGPTEDDQGYSAEETLKDLYLISAISAMKYATLRLVPMFCVGSSDNWPSDLGPPSDWARVATRRRRFRARTWSIPAAALECTILCVIVLLVSGSVDGIAKVHLTAVLVVNALITIDSFGAAVVSHRRGFREVFPELEVIEPVRYKDLVRSLPGGVGNAGDKGCAICLQDFDPQESAVRLPCGHIFHAECAGEWVGRGHGCPYRCKHKAARLAWGPLKPESR